MPATSISSVKVSFNFDKLLLLLLLLLYRKKCCSVLLPLFIRSRDVRFETISLLLRNFLTRRLAKARFAPNFSLFLSRKISIDSPSRNFSSGQVFLFTSFYLFIHLIRLRFNTSWHKYYSVHRLINEKYRTVRRYRYHLSVFPARIFFESSNKSIVFHRGRFFTKSIIIIIIIRIIYI